jgi:hypothetical protein
MPTQNIEEARRALMDAHRTERDAFDAMILTWPNPDAEVRWMETNRKKLDAFRTFQRSVKAKPA